MSEVPLYVAHDNRPQGYLAHKKKPGPLVSAVHAGVHEVDAVLAGRVAPPAPPAPPTPPTCNRGKGYMGISLIRKRNLLGSYCGPMPKVIELPPLFPLRPPPLPPASAGRVTGVPRS